MADRHAADRRADLATLPVRSLPDDMLTVKASVDEMLQHEMLQQTPEGEARREGPPYRRAPRGSIIVDENPAVLSSKIVQRRLRDNFSRGRGMATKSEARKGRWNRAISHQREIFFWPPEIARVCSNAC